MSRRNQAQRVGQHAIVEATGPVAHFSAPQLLALMEQSALAAGATILGRHGHGFGDKQGQTCILLLAESHISVHTWPEFDYAAFDLFMCGAANLERALKVLTQPVTSPAVTAQAVAGNAFSIKIISRGRQFQKHLSPEQAAAQLFQRSPLVLAKISDAVKLPKVQTKPLITELIKFLVLCSTGNEDLLPSAIIHTAWQQLVLFTELYDNFCHQYLSRFIHYQPESYAETRYCDYQKTLGLYRTYFGSPPATFWPVESARPLGCVK